MVSAIQLVKLLSRWSAGLLYTQQNFQLLYPILSPRLKLSANIKIHQPLKYLRLLTIIIVVGNFFICEVSVTFLVIFRLQGLEYCNTWLDRVAILVS